ncbi:alpha/beta hydrolase [Myxococcus fulvus]|uniref:alpha/beta hydrolase n=1 Tax=Myxococcus fulvus TaxID=33 RepID=UPI0020BD5677|nr:alpha/beta hydrolase [Myxococcus fulvus]MCK8498716.1 alpha/beta hydrolase [Myxococcus fulvus]
MADDTKLTLLERLEFKVASALFRLPPPMLVRLSGKPPVVIDGLRLHPEVQLLLSLRERKGVPRKSELPLSESRNRLRREALMHSGVLEPVASVTSRVLETKQGPLRARHYVPPGDSRGRPLLVFFHGGGFVMGDLDTHDSPCRRLCHHAGVHVLSIDYRLAPEHPFPAAVEDAIAAFEWALEHAASLGADPERVAVGGDSAGGNLAAVVAQHTVREGTRKPALQFLLYPTMDRTRDWGSLSHFAEGFFLTRVDVEWYQEQYMMGSTTPLADPRVSPRQEKSLVGAPPALIVTAGFDPLRDEAEAYATALREAGTPTTLRRFDSLVHAFANMSGLSRACREATVEVARLLRRMLDEVEPSRARNGANT